MSHLTYGTIKLELPETPVGSFSSAAFEQFSLLYRALHLLKEAIDARDGILLLSTAEIIPPISFVSLVGETVVLASAAALSTRAVAFVSDGIAISKSGLVDFSFSIQEGFSALIPGSIYYLSTTPGLYTLTPPSASGTIVQEVGIAVSSTNLFVRISSPVLNPTGPYPGSLRYIDL